MEDSKIFKQLPPPSGLPKPKQIKTEPVDDQLMVQGIEASGPENNHITPCEIQPGFFQQKAIARINA